MRESYGSFLRERRTSERLTQKRLSDDVGIDFTYLSKLENDRLPPPSEETITALARRLGDDPEEHLNRAKKVALTRRAVESYPIEATMLLRTLAAQRLPKETYLKMLRLARASMKRARAATNDEQSRR